MFFRKKRSPSLGDPTDRLLELAEQVIAICHDALPINYSEDNFEYVARNSDCAISSHLERLALLHRSKSDIVRAKAELTKAQPFIDHVLTAIYRCSDKGASDANFVHVSNLTHALLATFLANDWDRANRLARAGRLAVVKEEGLEEDSGGIHDVIAKMLIATADDDKAWYERLLARFTNARTFDTFFERYFRYDALMTLIHSRENSRFDAALKAQETSFLARAVDKQLDHGQILDGRLENNSLVFDVWTVALANLARCKGLRIQHTSEVIPTDVYASAA